MKAAQKTGSGAPGWSKGWSVRRTSASTRSGVGRSVAEDLSAPRVAPARVAASAAPRRPGTPPRRLREVPAFFGNRPPGGAQGAQSGPSGETTDPASADDAGDGRQQAGGVRRSRSRVVGHRRSALPGTAGIPARPRTRAAGNGSRERGGRAPQRRLETTFMRGMSHVRARCRRTRPRTRGRRRLHSSSVRRRALRTDVGVSTSDRVA